MNEEVETAVVILNWNGRKYLEKFLPKLLACTPGPDIAIIVADNRSDDDSVAFLQKHYPGIRLILNPCNEGFAKGYNDALARIKARFYVLLNSDIEVTPNWVAPVIGKMKQDPSIAAAQPKIRAFSKRESFEYAGAAGGFIDYLGYPFCRGRIFDSVEEDKGQYDQACEIFWATGAALFVRADLYRQCGGLDNDFFAHMEEIDLCWRLKNAGYKIMYYPDSVVYHIGGGTLPKKSPRKTYLNFRNNLLLLYKNLPQKSLRPVMAKRFFLDMAAAAAFLAKGSLADCKAVFQARKDFNRMKTSKRAAGKIPEKFPAQVYLRSIVLDYNLKKRRAFPQLDPERFLLPNPARQGKA